MIPPANRIPKDNHVNEKGIHRTASGKAQAVHGMHHGRIAEHAPSKGQTWNLRP